MDVRQEVQRPQDLRALAALSADPRQGLIVDPLLSGQRSGERRDRERQRRLRQPVKHAADDTIATPRFSQRRSSGQAAQRGRLRHVFFPSNTICAW